MISYDRSSVRILYSAECRVLERKDSGATSGHWNMAPSDTSTAGTRAHPELTRQMSDEERGQNELRAYTE